MKRLPRRQAPALLLVSAFALVGCDFETAMDRYCAAYPCTDAGARVPDGTVSDSGSLAPADAGAVDSGLPDPEDAGGSEPDAGPTDSGHPYPEDAGGGEQDAGPPDAGHPDPADAGGSEQDAGPADSGAPEPADGGQTVDAGPVDAGPGPLLPDGGLGARVVSLGLGAYHTCAVTEAGALWCWGSNDSAQLSDPRDSVAVTSPRHLGGGYTDVSLGVARTCALRAAGNLACWGVDPRNVAAPDGGRWTSATTGWRHVCAVTDHGQAMCFGANGKGQLGGSDIALQGFIPLTAGDGGTWTQLSAGENHTCGLLAAPGNTYCWGDNASKQVLDDELYPATSYPVPQHLPGVESRMISAGYYHSCAVLEDGVVACWGDNSGGQLGRPSTPISQGQVLPVDSDRRYRSVSAAQLHTCAVTEAGQVECWGYNNYQQCGPGLGMRRSVPTPVATLVGTFSEVRTGQSHSCAVSTEGALWCWGNDDTGQLGQGSLQSIRAPVQVAIPR